MIYYPSGIPVWGPAGRPPGEPSAVGKMSGAGGEAESGGNADGS